MHSSHTVRPWRTARGLVVIECERDLNDPPRFVRCTVSVPGRDGVMTREWEAAYGRVNAQQAADISSWIAKTVDNAIACSIGVQGLLAGA